MSTFVLVHGGSYTSACWERIAPLLDGKAVLVDLPGRGRRPDDLTKVTLADSVAATIADIEAATADDVVLVGHSMAGITVAHVVNQIPNRIRQVVLISCTIPPSGTSVVDHIDPDVRDSVLDRSTGGVFRLNEETARAILCNDLDDEQTSFALNGMVDEASSMLTEIIDLTGLQSQVPVTYVRLLNDRCLPPDQQNAAIAALRNAEVIELDSGHMAMIGHPAELAAILNDIGSRPARDAAETSS